MLLMVAAPPVTANCVRAPEPVIALRRSHPVLRSKTRRTRQSSVGAERKRRADIDPRDLGTGRVGIALIKKIPAVLMRSAERGAVGFGPTQLQIDRRAGRVEARH